MSREDELLALRERLPGATCPEGCFACCAEGVRVAHTELRRMVPPPGVCLTGCVWLSREGRCRVYDERPIRCRAFGLATDGDFHCPDCKPDREISNDEILAIIKEYEYLTAEEAHLYSALGQEISRRINGDKEADRKNKEAREHNDGSAKRAGPWT